MSNREIIAGIDAGHINTKAVIMRGPEILGYGTSATRFEVAAAARAALGDALAKSEISGNKINGIVSTGIFKEVLKDADLGVTVTVPEYEAEAKGAFFLNKNARTVIDIGGNIHKAVHFSKNGDVLDVIQNDKCADGLGIFYTNMARALGVTEEDLSELALESTGDAAVAIQCALCAESEAIDLLCQGVKVADMANAVSKFMADRVAAMCTYMPLTKEIVVGGGLAKCSALVDHLSALLKQDVVVAEFPDYLGAIGAVASYGGGK